MPDLSEDVHHAGSDEPNDEVPKRTKRNSKAEGTLGDPQSRAAKSWWPFKYSLEDNRWYVNKAKQRSKTEQAQDVGDALL